MKCVTLIDVSRTSWGKYRKNVLWLSPILLSITISGISPLILSSCLQRNTIPTEQPGKPRGALTAPRTEDPLPSSSSPSGSWSSLSVQDDTSSTELVRSGKLLDVNLRRSSAEFSCGDTQKAQELSTDTNQFWKLTWYQAKEHVEFRFHMVGLLSMTDVGTQCKPKSLFLFSKESGVLRSIHGQSHPWTSDPSSASRVLLQGGV
jgi:hypothetical protein